MSASSSSQSLTASQPSGALLRTPDAYQGQRGGSEHPDKRRAGGHAVTLQDQVEHELLPTPTTDPDTGNGHARNLGAEVKAVDELLPTPRASRGASGTETMYALGGERVDDGRPQGEVVFLPTPNASQMNYDDDPEKWEVRRAAAAAKHGNNGIGLPLGIAAQLLPTPLESEGRKAGVQNSEDRLKTGQVFLSNIIQDVVEQTDDRFLPTPTARTNWGKYEAAIRRAEAVTGEVAPPPTLPDGRDGKRRLASRFVEWMMMLPEGTVTGHGLGRTPELSRLGNGVVPIQAGVAFGLLVGRMAEIDRNR